MSKENYNNQQINYQNIYAFQGINPNNQEEYEEYISRLVEEEHINELFNNGEAEDKEYYVDNSGNPYFVVSDQTRDFNPNEVLPIYDMDYQEEIEVPRTNQTANFGIIFDEIVRNNPGIYSASKSKYIEQENQENEINRN